jgi:phage-related protein
MSLPIIVISPCEKELKKFSKEILGDLLDAVALLQSGLTLSMPLSRPMPSIIVGAHELRLKDQTGIYRIFYFIKAKKGIYFVHPFQKKNEQTPKKNIDLARKRIKELP